MNREIPIIFDELADPQFGTGVVKVTPAHDPNDLEAGKRHNLPHVKVIGEDARMTADAGPYAGLDRFEARKRVVADLEKLGLLEKIEPYPLAISKCDRCGTIVEPLVSTQWFVKTKPLAAKVLDAVNERPHRIRPRKLEQDVLQLDGEHPRLVHFAAALVGSSHSRLALRRLQEDHRGPRSARRPAPIADRRASNRIPTCSTPGSAPACGRFQLWAGPTTPRICALTIRPRLLITGYDILFFWAARMMMLGLELTGDVPFRQVHLHTLVRDP